MSDSNLVVWAVPRLAQLLPLDEESLTQIITYSAGLSKEEGADHLKNLLGDSPAAFEFISSFNARREHRRSQPTASSAAQGGEEELSAAVDAHTTSNVTGARGGPKKGKKPKAPLHSAGPVRRPENFGNVTGGYRKEDQDEDYMSAAPARGQTRQDTATLRSKGSTSSLQVPQQRDTSSHESSAVSSRNQSPAPRTSTVKNPPSASGPVLSDLLPNVKSKAAKLPSRNHGAGSGAGSPKGSLTTNSISDLTAAIAALEVSTNPTLSDGGRKCNCYATVHPLFEPVPNCLNCGKIICSLESLQPCSFCGTPLLSNEEVQSMIRELRAERGQEKMRAHNESVHREGGPGPTPVGSSKLDAAKAHRDKLLQFQAQNAKRTRVVDEAADFETPNVASTLWMSPAQRALALKKQQRILREMEEKARPEWEKKKTVMSLDIKGGRVTRVYQSAAPAESSSAAEGKDEDVEDAPHGETKRSGGEAFSHNPLLAAGGLLRPIWKATDDKHEGGTTQKERKQTWRRVQDDNDDNEQWILDGGLHGYTS